MLRESPTICATLLVKTIFGISFSKGFLRLSNIDGRGCGCVLIIILQKYGYAL